MLILFCSLVFQCINERKYVNHILYAYTNHTLRMRSYNSVTLTVSCFSNYYSLFYHGKPIEQTSIRSGVRAEHSRMANIHHCHRFNKHNISVYAELDISFMEVQRLLWASISSWRETVAHMSSQVRPSVPQYYSVFILLLAWEIPQFRTWPSPLKTKTWPVWVVTNESYQEDLHVCSSPRTWPLRPCDRVVLGVNRAI